jgi:hypothetical protein
MVLDKPQHDVTAIGVAIARREFASLGALTLYCNRSQ